MATAKATTKAENLTQVVTGTVRLSFAHIWEPASVQDGDPKKYSACLLIPKTDTLTLSKINAAVETAKKAGLASKWGGKLPANLKLPLRDGDAEKADDENYKGMYFVNASANQQPGVLDRNKNVILDKTEIYSGCYIMASVNFYPFNKRSNGIACGLNNIMKVKDGPPLSGRKSATDDFADIEVEIDDEDI